MLTDLADIPRAIVHGRVSWTDVPVPRLVRVILAVMIFYSGCLLSYGVSRFADLWRTLTGDSPTVGGVILPAFEFLVAVGSGALILALAATVAGGGPDRALKPSEPDDEDGE